MVVYTILSKNANATMLYFGNTTNFIKVSLSLHDFSLYNLIFHYKFRSEAHIMPQIAAKVNAAICGII